MKEFRGRVIGEPSEGGGLIQHFDRQVRLSQVKKMKGKGKVTLSDIHSPKR